MKGGDLAYPHLSWLHYNVHVLYNILGFHRMESLCFLIKKGQICVARNDLDGNHGFVGSA